MLDLGSLDEEEIATTLSVPTSMQAIAAVWRPTSVLELDQPGVGGGGGGGGGASAPCVDQSLAQGGPRCGVATAGR
jgi:hypothetical protein